MPRGHALDPEAKRAKCAARQAAAWRAGRPAKPRKYEGTRAERRAEASRDSHNRHRDKRLAAWREWYDRQLTAKAGRPRPSVCDVCGEPGKICLDHSHATDAFRGWLCSRCNLALGHARDNPDVLRKLAAYLEGQR